MNNSNDKSELLREIAIFDYVAGNQSESVMRNFEKMLEQDASLREAVDQEARLRRAMHEAGKNEPVSMSNFQALLNVIDENEMQTAGGGKSDRQSATAKSSISRYISSYYASVASVAACAALFGTFYFNFATPDFETLSDIPASEQIDFTELAGQMRLAKMTFSNDMSQDQIDELLLTYSLTSFEAGAPSEQRYVVAEVSISENELTRLRNDARILSVELFTPHEQE